MNSMFLSIITFFLILTSNVEACEIIEESFSGDWTERYLVILPKNYDPTKEYGTVYFLHGRDGNRHFVKDLGICQQLDRLVDEGETPFIVIAPDGGNSYWLNGALTGQRWADMVTGDLIEDAEKKYPLVSRADARVIAGISMGGHGAIQLSLNFPGVYGAIGAHSPVFRTQEEASKNFYYEFGTGLDFQERDPFSLINNLGKKITTPIYIDMGARDVWISNTKNFQQLLQSQYVSGEFHVGEDGIGAHDLRYWKYHMESYVNWYSKNLPSPR
jgi:putative tributyrin esterase